MGYFRYLIAIIAVLIVLKVIITVPDPTGKVIGPGKIITASVLVKTSDQDILPKGSIVLVSIRPNETNPISSIEERKAILGIEEFLRLSGKPFTLEEGENKKIDYNGPGYLGDQTYEVGLEEFNINRILVSGVYVMETRILYGSKLVSSGIKVITVE